MLLACLNKSVLNIEKFSRWLRAICSILLARNRPSDRVKALGYIEQAVEVIKDHIPDNGNNTEIAQVCVQFRLPNLRLLIPLHPRCIPWASDGGYSQLRTITVSSVLGKPGQHYPQHR